MAVTKQIAEAESAAKKVEMVEFKLTGRKRFRVFDKWTYSNYHLERPKDEVLILELEESALTTVGGITAQETRWREAKPDDCPNETVLGV